MSRPPSLAMNTVPFEFIKNTRKQLLSVSYFLESRTFQETSRDEFSVLLSEWGETEHVEYLEVTFYFSPTDNLLW
ncbi:hypothetical protein L596_010071 [Steinernema carpocapsae]|uniref:Uncharacterized protein n=1 Tax=Steinernema carpocapsae TaxID=34508 RepID=A0A4U5PIJ2_STECR|nr:hypothetical protein L596_010071 [Steinernema carpocapsae]